MQKNTLALAVSAVAMGFAIVGCGGGGGGSSSGGATTNAVKLSGTLKIGYEVQSDPSFVSQVLDAVLGKTAHAISTDVAVTAVWAVPVNRNDSPFTAYFDQKKVAELAADGSFSVEVDTLSDWVLVLVDENATNKRDELVGFVALTDNADLSLLLVPVSEMNEGEDELDVGEVSKDGDEAQSASLNETTAAKFSYGLDALKELASVDDSFKLLRNQYVNGSTTNMDVTFMWGMPTSTLVGEGDYGGTLVPNSHPWLAGMGLDDNGPGVFEFGTTNYAGYRFKAATEIAEIVGAGLCPDVADGQTGDAPDSILITPPEGVTQLQVVSSYGGEATTYEQFDNFGASVVMWDSDWGGELGGYCSGNGVGIEYGADDHGTARVGLGTDGDSATLGEVPEGWWALSFKQGNETFAADGSDEFAWFDIHAASPFDAYGNPVVYLPAPTVNTTTVNIGGTDEQVIESIALKWYRWNGSAYEEITDFSVMGGTVTGTDVKIGAYAPRVGMYTNITDLTVDEFPVEAMETDDTLPAGATAVNWVFGSTTTYDGTDGNVNMEEVSVSYSIAGVHYWFRFRDYD